MAAADACADADFRAHRSGKTKKQILPAGKFTQTAGLLNFCAQPLLWPRGWVDAPDLPVRACCRKIMRRRAIAAMVGAPVAGLALFPAGDRGETPSGLTLLKLLAQTRISTLISRGNRSACYEVTVQAAGGVEVLLCGTCHVEQSSSKAVRAAFARQAREPGGVSAVAVECDAQTLELLRVADTAIAGMPPDRLKSEGIGRVRAALFQSEVVRELAKSKNAPLTDPSCVVLPPAIGRHLARDGVLWGGEMREAACVAEEAGARVACLGPIHSSAPSSPPSQVAMLIGQAAYWLRVRALRPGLDERSCEPASISAANEALRELMPRLYRHHVTEPDELMAGRIRMLCDEVAASARSAKPRWGSGKQAAPPPRILVVVGAQHVSGLQQKLMCDACDAS